MTWKKKVTFLVYKYGYFFYCGYTFWIHFSWNLSFTILVCLNGFFAIIVIPNARLDFLIVKIIPYLHFRFWGPFCNFIRISLKKGGIHFKYILYLVSNIMIHLHFAPTNSKEN
jgi:hypothetical protein